MDKKESKLPIYETPYNIIHIKDTLWMVVRINNHNFKTVPATPILAILSQDGVMALDIENRPIQEILLRCLSGIYDKRYSPEQHLHLVNLLCNNVELIKEKTSTNIVRYLDAVVEHCINEITEHLSKNNDN